MIAALECAFMCTAMRLDGFLPEWLRKLIRNREWQKSSALSSLFWCLNTLIVYKLVALLGHGWQVNVLVSLAWDVVTYLICKLGIWDERHTGYKSSSSRWFAVWGFFFLLNGSLAWLLMSRADVGTIGARCLLGAFGILINPLIFMIRDRGIFPHPQQTEKA